MDELKLLQKLGLTEYEARAYFSLAKLGPSTVREIVLYSKLPRNKAYDALQTLENKNKVVSIPISPKKYKITAPELFQREVQELSASVDSLIKIIEQPKITEFKEMFWVLKSKKAIEEKLDVQNTKAQKEILSCNNLSKILYKNIQTLTEAVNRGVKVKMICTFDNQNIASYKAWLKTWANIRVFNSNMFGPLLPRITIIDGEISRLTIGKPEVKAEEEYLTLWTESKAFSQMLKHHFINMWNASEPIGKYLRKSKHK